MYSFEKVGAALRERVSGEVSTDERTLTRYATDQSMYEIRPLVVVHPRDLADVLAVVRFARDATIPLTPRGRGSRSEGKSWG